MLDNTKQSPDDKQIDVPDISENSLDDASNVKLGKNEREDLTEDLSEHVWGKFSDIDSYEDDFPALQDTPCESYLKEEMHYTQEESRQNFPEVSNSPLKYENLSKESNEEANSSKINDNTSDECNEKKDYTIKNAYMEES